MTDRPIGLERGTVEIVDYHRQWPDLFRREADCIQDACGDAVQTIEHIGSTSVPGLAAKPVLDIMPGLEELEDGDRMVEPMIALGYEYRGDYGIPGRHLFVRFEDNLSIVHAHAFVVDSDQWIRHLSFCRYLQRHADVAKEYERLKRDLAARHADDRDTYTDEKTDFIKSIESKARAEFDAANH